MAAFYPENKVVGNYLGAGACGFAFEVVGEPDKVLKVSRLVDYESIDPKKIADFKKDGMQYDEWDGGIGLNEFQAVLFSELWDRKMKGEEVSPHLPEVYAFSSGEIQQELLDEIRNSYEKHEWDSNKYQTIKNNFIPRKGNVPGSRIALWVIEKVDRIGEKPKKAEKDVKKMNKWLRENHFVVRDTKNPGNWGQRIGSEDVVWFDPGVAPYPILKAWKDSDDVQLRNLYWLFRAGYGQDPDDYRGVDSDPDKYDGKWHQAEQNLTFSAEDANLIEKFLAESDSIGKYIDSGAAGSVFAVNDDKVLKIAKLNHTFNGYNINQDQAGFIEDIWIRKNKGEEVPSEMVDILHYNRGTVTPEMASIVNAKTPAHSIEAGEPVAVWIMERIPCIGNCELSEYDVEDAEQNLKKWGRDMGYRIGDLHDKNYGQRDDGSYVAFDPWPTKI